MATTRQVRIVPQAGLGSMHFAQSIVNVPVNIANVDLGIFRSDLAGNPDGLMLTSKVLPGFTASPGLNFFFQSGGQGTNHFEFEPGDTDKVLRITDITGAQEGSFIRLNWTSATNVPVLDNAQGAPTDADNNRFANLEINFTDF